MAQVINTNSLSLMTQNNLNASQSQLNTAIQRLSSGLRINSAKDDAAGQAIANRFTSNINGLTQAQRNANDGISMAQTTEGALTEVTNNLQRIRQLSVQAANGSNSSSDLQSIQDEITQRMSEIDRISAQTDFNGVKVLSSKASPLNIQVGANDGQTISVNLQEISTKTLGMASFNVSGTGTANTAATENDLKLAGTATGAPVNGTQQYDVTSNNKAATTSDLYSKIGNGDVVTDTTTAVAYTYNSAQGAFTFNEAGRTNVNTIAALKPPVGSSLNATVTIGGKSTDISVDSAGNITDAASGKQLYLDASKNLTQTGAGAVAAATLTNLTAVGTGMQAGDTITLSGTGTVYTAAGAGAFNVTGDTIKANVLQDKIKTAADTSTVKIGANTYNVNAAGTPTNAYFDTTGALTTTATTTASYYVHSNGSVTDSASNVVYTDSANPGGFTLNARSGTTTTTNPLDTLDKALSIVDKLRSSLGAIQNRLDSTISNLGTTINNLSSSRSRIQDADYATEVSNMTRANILQQAGTSVLAQANQTTQGVLSLLR
ncbi:Flagellin [Cupriavidus yeoncheonensis]|uniref:Flagellin n=1 Tax=Cupriavidus yeoncheonensis TaxID=1462994 RepID=A0A916IYQ7_9BURK|nr:flagellin [Cupriavidus yeoncheonensis]CAG2154535.1 Flagellin [Cupriavidus yeoncheonensis]